MSACEYCQDSSGSIEEMPSPANGNKYKVVSSEGQVWWVDAYWAKGGGFGLGVNVRVTMISNPSFFLPTISTL